MASETETKTRNRRRGTCTEAIYFVLTLRAYKWFGTLGIELGLPLRNAPATVVLVALAALSGPPRTGPPYQSPYYVGSIKVYRARVLYAMAFHTDHHNQAQRIQVHHTKTLHIRILVLSTFY